MYPYNRTLLTEVVSCAPCLLICLTTGGTITGGKDHDQSVSNGASMMDHDQDRVVHISICERVNISDCGCIEREKGASSAACELPMGHYHLLVVSRWLLHHGAIIDIIGEKFCCRGQWKWKCACVRALCVNVWCLPSCVCVWAKANI